MSKHAGKRVILGMSGGVDSSVSALLLKDAGYTVIGMTMQLLPKEKLHESSCCNLGAINDAKRICDQLDIPHYTINSRESFDNRVIQPFIQSYQIGETPNPCVECNRYIKFDELWSYANDLDADFVATGHYSRISYSTRYGQYYLKTGLDPKKDQSYFLYMLNQEKLKKILFPLGDRDKESCRKLAEERGLITAKKSDSQEICFVSQASYKTYLKDAIPDANRLPGPILDTNGHILGYHQGIYQFTVGQRRGINISSEHPLYVLAIHPERQAITVGPKPEKVPHVLTLRQMTTVSGRPLEKGKRLPVKLRYRSRPIQCTVLSHVGDVASIQVNTAISQLSPGQSAVFYKGPFVLGGGIIDAVSKA